jgi:hypothetical protein
MDHVKEDHGSTHSYLATYHSVETKASYVNCKYCDKEVKRNYW